MLKVVGATRTRTFRVLWLLEELGLDYEHDPAAPRSEAAKALNPTGKVPMLIDRGAVLTDSVAIMTYLSDKHGKFTFPAGTLKRGQLDGIVQFIVTELDAVLWTAARHTFALPEEKRVPEIKDSLRWEFDRAIGQLAANLENGPYLCGDQFTIADILATHCGSWATNARFPISSERFRDYATSMRSRPAYQRAASK